MVAVNSSRAGPALALAGATMLAAGCGGAALAGGPGPHTSVVDAGATVLPTGPEARCLGAPRLGDRPAGYMPPGQVRLTRTATVSFGAAASAPVMQVAPVPCSSPGVPAGAGLCPPGFWLLYRLSGSAGHHPPALFPFPAACGIAGKAATTAEPGATPAPLQGPPG
jgi:hypothetical protein